MILPGVISPFPLILRSLFIASFCCSGVGQEAP